MQDITTRPSKSAKTGGAGSKTPAWLTDLVVAASLTIALNSLLTDLVALGILPDDDGYRWWHQCFFTWQIPAFYFFSGYLYQRESVVDSLKRWGLSVRYRFIVNAVPFLVFTVFLLLTNTMTASVLETPDHGADGLIGINFSLVATGQDFSFTTFINALLVSPLTPYGYFYCLFLIFVIVPTVKTRRGMVALGAVGVLAKIAALLLATCQITSPYGVNSVLEQLIWFVLGMALAFRDCSHHLAKPRWIVMFALVYLISSVAFIGLRVENPWTHVWCALMAGIAILAMLMKAFPDGFNLRPLRYLGNYTMAIYLFHPVFLKLLWWLLDLASITNPLIYILGGIFVAFVLPVLVMMGLNRCWKLGFMVYPARYLTLKP